MRGRIQIIGGMALLAIAASGTGAAVKKRAPAAAEPNVITKALAQNCDAHHFETTVHLTGPDGQPKQSKVKMCGTEGQSDADWIHTLQDAVKKTSLSVQMPPAAREQIIAAVNAEIERLSHPGLALPTGGDISKLAKSAPARTEEVPLSRDYGSLGELPTAPNVEPPHVLGPGAAIAPAPRLSLRCALDGDAVRALECDTIDLDTVMVMRADDAYPRGVEVRFVRHGDQRAELNLPAMKQGQTATLRLPKAVCAGVVRSRVEIQALGANSPTGTPAGSIGEYDLRC
jgi:hypothetical protein